MVNVFNAARHEESFRKKAAGSLTRFEEAKASLAGGVSSGLRRAQRPFPMYFESGSGSKIRDVDGNAYIDYTLAQICAFQFWVRDRHDHADAWNDYVRLCQAGGSQSFLRLVKEANLRSPFDDGCVESVVGDIRRFLDSVDDSRL